MRTGITDHSFDQIGGWLRVYQVTSYLAMFYGFISALESAASLYLYRGQIPITPFLLKIVDECIFLWILLGIVNIMGSKTSGARENLIKSNLLLAIYSITIFIAHMWVGAIAIRGYSNDILANKLYAIRPGNSVDVSIWGFIWYFYFKGSKRAKRYYLDDAL